MLRCDASLLRSNSLKSPKVDAAERNTVLRSRKALVHASSGGDDTLSTSNNPPTPPQQPVSPKPSSNRKYILLGVGIFVFLVIVGQSGSHDNKNTSSTTSSSSTSPSSHSSTNAAPPAPQPPPVTDLTISDKSDADSDNVFVSFKAREGFTDGLTKDGARYDTSLILQYALRKYPKLTEVIVSVNADMTDMYGNSKMEEVATLSYSRATLEKINWSNFDPNNMWNMPIADTAEVFPAFRY